MNERRSLQLLAEQYNHVQTNQILRDAFERDLKAFEQYLVQEGLWDTIKQKGSQLVGGAKNALIQPLIKMVLDKLAQSDPEGYKKLQAAANDPAKLQALLNSPEVQQQQQSLGQDVATTAEGLDEELYDEYLNEAYSYLVDEAWIDPKTGKFVAPGTPGAIERKSGAPLSQTPNAIKKRAARAAAKFLSSIIFLIDANSVATFLVTAAVVGVAVAVGVGVAVGVFIVVPPPPPPPVSAALRLGIESKTIGSTRNAIVSFFIVSLSVLDPLLCLQHLHDYLLAGHR